VTLVWIDSREAIIGRWREGAAELERVESEVPAHHRATGRVRHDPTVRHGGGHATGDEPHRLEHLDRFLDQVAAMLPPDEALVVIGPGTVREHLVRHVREIDERQHRTRPISAHAAPRLTERQLVARVRRLVGAEPSRRTVGAYRWIGAGTGPDGGSSPRPRRVLRKPPRNEDDEPEALVVETPLEA
jgi:hypothetical protein